MAENESLTVTLPHDMAARIRAAVEAGAYATPDDVVREALHDWASRPAPDFHALAALRADIAAGLADAAAGRVGDFDPGRIADLGRTLLRTRSHSG